MRRPILAALLLLCSSTGSATATPDAKRADQAPCPVDPALAELVAASDLILIGAMDVPKARLVEAARSAPEYIDLPTRAESILKGEDIGSVIVRFYPRDASYQPSNDRVLGLAGAPALLFLTRVDGAAGGLYFAGHSPDALQSATGQRTGAVRAEITRQQAILRNWRADSKLPRFDEVRALLARLGTVRGDAQQRVFDRLEGLGTQAVPAIVAQMDDRRALNSPEITLANHGTDAFEAARHYGPQQVVDALDAVLSQVTGASFGSIANGGSDRERAAVVAAWRIYAADLACKKPVAAR